MATKGKERRSKGSNNNISKIPKNTNEVAKQTERSSGMQIDRVDGEQNTSYNELNMSDDEEGGTRIGDIYIPPPIPAYCSTESKGPRLIIKKIENNNFKSYAGKVELGPFHHCFTAIIGPNGSGKSNVIDSMLFVFGYRANKIRCKKISTLLHNSARFPNVSKCSVAVHFRQILDSEDGSCEEIPNSEIIVERTAFRDNSSFYTINGRKVQFKEVASLLKKHHVDLDHNRFLILQGEVESIAMMKPKGLTETECGMLEYLEDIVGTTRYKEPLVKINERVEKLTEERTEKHNRCKLAEREMKDLEQPYNEAVDYLRQENENTRTKNLRIQKYLSEKNKKLEEYSQQYNVIKEDLIAHDNEADTLRKEREEKEEIVRKEMKQFEMLRQKKEDFEKKLEKANKEYAEVQQIMKKLNETRKQNKAQMEKNETDLVELHKVPEKNKKEIAECEKKLEQVTKQKVKEEEELQRNYKRMEEQTKPLIEEREKRETELIDLKIHVDEAKADLALSESELKILKHDEVSETRKYESMKTSYEESQKTLNEKKVTMQELEGNLPVIKKEIEEKSNALLQLQQNEQNMRTQLMTIKSEINEKTISMQAVRSNNKVLDFLMRQKNEGKIPGILGRLGDLGGIDTKYDVAISTACGRLDNIIVDKVNTAQECIEYLKRYDVGRASFIALEKVKYLEKHSARFQTPENAPRLYDLIRVEDERVLPAFYFALRNTLVANDLEQGTRIAYGVKRYRVVTLKGDVIETSGTMSGGGRTQIRGKMGTKVQTKTKQSTDNSLVTQKALEDLQIQAEQLQSEINFNQEEQGRLEREVQQSKLSQQRTEADLQKILITIRSLEEQLPRIFKQLEVQRTRMQKSTTDTNKVKNIEEAIAIKVGTLKKAEKAANKVTEKINQIKTQIDTIHGETVKAVQNKINNLDNQIKKLNNNVSKLKAEVTNSERNVIKMEAQIERLRAEILKSQDKLKELSEKRQRHDDEMGEFLKHVETANADIEKAKSGASNIHKEIQNIEKRESELKLKRVEIEQKLQTVGAKISDVKSQIPHWREQLKPLRLHEIPGDAEPQAPLKTYTEEELAAHTLQDIQYKESVQEELLKKKPNLSCIGEYIEKRDIYLERVKVLEDVTCKRNEMRQLYDDVRKKRYNEFMHGFHIITRKLKEMYQMITQGGDAELELVDSMDPFTEGVSFSVRPPKKTWKNISNLSGGEKTLSSLALVFALHYYKPSPLYFMDEIDAALDFKNISIVAHYIKQRTKNAQFIIISLRSNMFELSDYLVGIYKVRDCTDSICLKNVPPELPAEVECTQQQQTQPQMQMQSQMTTQPQTVHMSPTINTQTSNVEANESSHSLDIRETNERPELPSTQNENNTDANCNLNSINLTFVPQIESTGISQNLEIDTSTLNRASLSVSSACNANNANPFKKPLTPSK
uniref:Structural maintenance of chromosomes protein n=1 Tax=Glossina brevipalpis TaxID=37001 RepID=A0A1A9X0Q7_9MUSC